MGVVEIILEVVLVLLSLCLIAVITLQSGKESGLSGALTGGKDSYLNKSKKGNKDQLLASATKWVALAFGVVALALNIVGQFA